MLSCSSLILRTGCYQCQDNGKHTRNWRNKYMWCSKLRSMVTWGRFSLYQVNARLRRPCPVFPATGARGWAEGKPIQQLNFQLSALKWREGAQIWWHACDIILREQESIIRKTIQRGKRYKLAVRGGISHPTVKHVSICQQAVGRHKNKWA